MTVYLNGKFLCQHMTGVQRTATNLLCTLDTLLAAHGPAPGGPWVLLCPPQAEVPALQHIAVRRIGRADQALGLWEQLTLPWAARAGRLLNLAGSAPALGRRQVCMLHDAAVFDRPQAYTRLFRTWYRGLFLWLSRRAQRLLTVSEFSRGRLVQRLGLPPQAIQVLPNGGDHLAAVPEDRALLDQHGLAPRSYVLVVGSANPNKNVALVESVFRHHAVGGPSRLVVVGGLNHRVFAPAGLTPFQHQEGCILRLGPVSDPALKALYRHAFCLVFPSVYEGFGLPALEAMSCGCPVVAASAGAVPEVCSEAALYFDPRSSASLRWALARLAQDPALQARLCEAGQRRVEAFPWARSARTLIQLMETMEGAMRRPDRGGAERQPTPSSR